MPSPSGSGTLQIEACTFRSVRVLILRGRVDLDTGRQLEAAIRDVVRHEPVVVDLHEVRDFHITGLGVLLRCRRLGQAHGHPVLVASPHRQFLRLVSATNLSRTLPCFPSLGAACLRARQIDRVRNPQPPRPPEPRR